MNINEIHYRIKMRGNKLDSNYMKNIPPAQLDVLINDTTSDYIEMFYTGNNIQGYDVGFEVGEQRIDMLSSLVVKNPDQGVLTPSNYDSTLKVYEFKFSGLKYPYRHFVRAYIFSDCGTISIVPTNLTQHDDLSSVLTDKTRKPSKLWKRIVATIGKDSLSSSFQDSSLYVYTGGEFTITGIYIEYVKQPEVVYFGGYNSLDGLYTTGDPQVDSDIPVTYHSLLCDMCVQNLFRNLLSPGAVGLFQKPNLTNGT